MTILTLCALLLIPAAPGPAPMMVRQSVSASPPAVVVRLGEASLEEYRHGNPANRTALLSGSQDARN